MQIPLCGPVLVADIGGTTTRVALADGARLRQSGIRRFANADFPDPGAVLTRYLAEMGRPVIAAACAAVAGPVRGGVATLTNLDWTITQSGLAAVTGARRAVLLNDLQAQGHALGHIAPEHLTPVIAAPDQAGAPKLVVGLGTGMNAALVHDTPGARLVLASECGHSAMPVRTDQDVRLAAFVARTAPHLQGFVGVEDVLSGRGLMSIHSFIRHEAGLCPDDRQSSAVDSAGIVAAIAQGDPMACQSARLFVHLLGHSLGNLALIHLPFGGIYLIGGLARAMRPCLDRMGLDAAFRDKGRFEDFMDQFAVSVIEDDYAALTGCAAALAA